MRKVHRSLLLGCAGLAALVVSGTALAAYSPSFVVAGSNHALGSGGPVTFNISQAETDDATAVMTLYSPLGYNASLSAAPGTQIGTASALVKVGILGGAKVPVTGTVNADDPAKYTSNQCSPGAHTAVWTITVTLAGTPVTVPVYVDAITAGPEAAFASSKIRVCFNHPTQSPSNPTGSQLLSVAFSVNVYTNPSTAGIYRWVGLFTPYNTAPGPPNVAGTIQAQTVQRLPVALNLTVKKVKRKGKTFAQLTGSLRAGDQAVSGQRVQLMSSTKSAKNATRVFRNVNTTARGTFSVLVPITKRTWFRAKTVIPSRASSGCGAVAVAPCGNVVTAPVGTTAKPLFSRGTVSLRP